MGVYAPKPIDIEIAQFVAGFALLAIASLGMRFFYKLKSKIHLDLLMKTTKQSGTKQVTRELVDDIGFDYLPDAMETEIKPRNYYD